MKIAITGSDGYIGTRLQREFRTNSSIELVLLSIITDSAPYIKVIFDHENLVKLFSGVDCVVHLAAKKVVKDYNDFMDNINLTNIVIDAAIDAGVKKFILASSISVYSDEKTIPWKENTAAESDTLYGVSKLICEQILKVKGTRAGMVYTSLRFGHVIGEEMPGSYMIPSFFRKAAAKETLTVIGKSIARRELVDVVDICRAVHWASINHCTDNLVLNIGSGVAVTNLEIANYMSQAFGDVKVNYDDSQNEGIKSSCMDISRAKELGFTPLYTPEKSIERVAKYQKGE